MKYVAMSLLMSAVLFSVGIGADRTAPVAKLPTAPANPQIDMNGYLRVSLEAAKHRETHRLAEEEFMRMSGEKGTIVLDARSKEKFDLLHVKGAINLNLSDINIESLNQLLPDKSVRILIYCNNNFKVPAGPQQQPQANIKVPNAPAAFMSKKPTASLNLSTYIALYNYGYKNVYELAPMLDPETTKLLLVSSQPSR